MTREDLTNATHDGLVDLILRQQDELGWLKRQLFGVRSERRTVHVREEQLWVGQQLEPSASVLRAPFGSAEVRSASLIFLHLLRGSSRNLVSRKFWGGGVRQSSSAQSGRRVSRLGRGPGVRLRGESVAEVAERCGSCSRGRFRCGSGVVARWALAFQRERSTSVRSARRLRLQRRVVLANMAPPSSFFASLGCQRSRRDRRQGDP